MYSFHELADIVQNEIKNLKYPQQPELLYAPIVYSLEEGGKRIRPVALLMACNLFRDEIDCAKPAALAVEVFHNFTLLHDDIMDRSDTRRGKPLHKLFAHVLTSYSRISKTLSGHTR